jgi:hypothetical protein
MQTAHQDRSAYGELSIMNLNKFSAIILFLLLGCQEKPNTIVEEDPFLKLRPKFTEEQILNRMRPDFYEALSGNGKAAMNISFELSKWISPAKRKIHPFEKWQRIGAENGYANAQHAYAQTLWYKRDHGDKEFYSTRAKYWAKRAADQGFLPGKEALERMEADEREEQQTNSVKSDSLQTINSNRKAN